jgi:aryl carrier-like protein
MYDDDSSRTSVPELTARYDSSDEEDSVLMSDEEMEQDDDICDDVWDTYQTDIEYHIPDPKTRPQNTPITILAANSIGCCTSRKLLKVLFDSGSSKSLISRSVIPAAAIPKRLSSESYCNTIAGKLKVTDIVTLRDIRLPEFDKNRKIAGWKALVYDAPISYDMILGNDFLELAKMKFEYEKKVISWFGNTVPLRNPRDFTSNDFDDLIECFSIQIDDEVVGDDWMESYITQILDAKYEKLDIDEFIDTQTHLDEAQKQDLRELLKKHEKLFDGTLGVYPHKKVHIELTEDAKPVHSRAYPIPKIHYETFKKELDHLVRIGVLEPIGLSEWASPTFIIPKKDGRVRWVSDLRALNKVVRRRQYPLPIINDILRRRTGYKFFTKLDISMQYYTFELDNESADLCTIVTPFGKYRYRRLPMGLKCSPDIAQEVMETIFRDIEDSEEYLDDIGAFSKSWLEHMSLLDKILTRLEDNGFTVNPLKCEWAVQETDWLGYRLTPTGLKPWKKKVDAITKLEPPTNLKQLRSLIGAVNYYRDMWPRRAHILAPLTAETGKKKFQWTSVMQDAFDKLKAMITIDALSAYPNHNFPFDIYTDASEYQLGAAIMQNGRPVAYYSKKLTGAQRNYTTMEKELLSIVVTLKEYRSMLLGAKITIHTDHKNLTFQGLTSQRVLRWRSFLEEYDINLDYVKGPENVLADAYSRVPRAESTVGKNMPNNDDIIEEHYLDCFYSVLDEPELFDCLLNLPELEEPTQNPLNMEWIRERQQADATLLARAASNPTNYVYKTFEDDLQILCYVKTGEDAETQWRIALAQDMVQPTIAWFHEVLGHPGTKRMRLTLQARYYHSEIRRYIDNYTCDACQ